MARETYVRTVDLETGDEVADGPFLTESAAIAFAESRAEEYFGGDDSTWYEPAGDGVYHVGRTSRSEIRSEPLVTITVKDREIELAEDLDPS